MRERELWTLIEARGLLHPKPRTDPWANIASKLATEPARCSSASRPAYTGFGDEGCGGTRDQRCCKSASY
jgi:hypothetical protein